MRTPRRTVAPAEKVVALADAKAHLRVDFDDDDAVLQRFLDAAEAHLDGWSGILGRCMVTQTWVLPLDCWLPEIVLPFPNAAVTEIAYRDADGVSQTVAATDYRVVRDGRGAVVQFWPTFTAPTLQDHADEPVTVTLTAGFGAAAAVPADLKIAIMLLAGHWFRHRETVTADALYQMPLGFDELVAKHRVRRL